ncbi:MAG: Rid family detoxifying hydrolase [Oscillospiraceae bacterium]|jgi:2-iminobutanoate/2-iminopropanoate deaminase|nr:Rid family detoxifying hydrolase [Oscillospiraceae bacterium]
MKVIHTASAPAAVGPYSQAIVSGGLVYTSGSIPLSPETGDVVGATYAEQAAAAISNLAAILAAAGSSLDRVIKTTCFLTDIRAFAEFNAVYAESFTGKPARSCVEVSALPKGVLVEIEAVAEVI